MRVLARRPLLIVIALLVAVGAFAAFPLDPPDDPNYAQNAACPPGGPTFPNTQCNSPHGQWNLFSFWYNNAPDPGHASGISADLAWQVSTGRRDTVVVVLDSGVNYDHEDLANKIWLNCGELPAPQKAGGSTIGGSSPGCREPDREYDLNGDGYFNVQDYAEDARVPDSVALSNLSRGDLRPFENGTDDDGNGFIDDISGWDARDGDGDEYRTNGNSHGTGRNGFIAAETDNGKGLAGICPECSLANVRVDGHFVTRTEGPAIGAIWAADHGHEVINMALGATTASTMTRAAFDYFTRKNGLALNASANEFSFHHNFQTVFDDVMAIGGVAPDFDEVQGFPNPSPTTTYLRKANFSNYGAHLDVVTPTDAETTGGGNQSYGDSSGTSSSVPHAAGVAGLIYSHARDVLDFTGLALQDISAQEVRQILNRSADDIVQADDPSGAGLYPLLPGWDRYTGYGRINAESAVLMVDGGTIPPEADINSPDWYRKVGRENATVTVEFYANARWESSFDWVLEVGAGIEPSSFTTISSGTSDSEPNLSSANLVSNFSETWDTTGLPERFYTLRLRVTDDQGNQGEDRMGVWIQRVDPDDHDGWPLTMAGLNADYPVSLESISTALVDLNGDNQLEIIFSTADGEIHAVQHDGNSLPGWPVRTDDVQSLPLAASDAFDGDPSNGEIVVTGSSVVGGVSVGDIDNDTVQEVCASAYNGKLYCWDATGALEPGFPTETDKGITRDQYTNVDEFNSRGDALLAPPTLADIDDDGDMELISGAFDQKLYIWEHDGSRVAPWPLGIGDVNTRTPAEIISSPVTADIDADGVMELVFGTNETGNEFGSPAGNDAGYLYAYDINGDLEPGWPVAVGPSPAPSAVPLVADGIGTSPVAVDIDGAADPAGNGRLEIAIGVLGSPPLIFNHDGSMFQAMNSVVGSAGPGRDLDEETPEGGLGSEPAVYYVAFGAFADVENDGSVEYINGSLGAGILPFAFGAGALADFDFYLSVWGAADGEHKAAFPRVIEDWQFFTGPSVADIDGGVDGVQEVITASGGYFVHAFNGVTGLDASGFPKNVGQWVVASPIIGDIDDDGSLELVVLTRLGDMHVWDLGGDDCETTLGASSRQWRKALHDEWGSGVLGTDTLRPAAITDLSVTGDADLTFTGVGDDGHCGTSDRYEVRSIAGSPLNPQWSDGTPETSVSGSADGTPQSIPVGPFGGSPTVLMVRAFDSDDNGSPVAVVPEPGSRLGLLASVLGLLLLARGRRR